MDFDPSGMDPAQSYRLLIGGVVPRPIAVVSTLSENGLPNLAPFSYFTIASHAPMSLLISVAGRKPEGGPKDTLRNATLPEHGGRGEFVVNIATEAYVQELARSAAPLPYGTSEFELTGLTPVPSRIVAPPRIAEASVQFECRTTTVVPVGSATLLIGQVVWLTVHDDLLDSKGRIDPARLQAVGRMAGSTYTRTTDRFDIEDQAFFPQR